MVLFDAGRKRGELGHEMPGIFLKVYHELKCGPNNFDGTTAWCNGWVLCEALFILVPQLLRRPVFC